MIASGHAANEKTTGLGYATKSTELIEELFDSLKKLC